MKPFRVLCITTSANKNTIESSDHLIKNDIFDVDILNDPTREQLENSIYEKQYSCIIPTCIFSLKEQNNTLYTFHKFNIIRLLECYNSNYLGSNYQTSLLLSDRPSYLNMLQKSSKGKILTKLILDKTKKEELNEFIPGIIKPLCDDYKECYKIYNINSLKNHENFNKILWQDKNITALYIQKNIVSSKTLSVIIIGNPPLSVDIVVGDDLDNITTNFKTALLNYSYDIFYKFNLRDFVELRYNYDKNDFYLDEINSYNVFSNTVIEALKNTYKINSSQIIYIFVLVMFSRKIINIEKDLLYKIFTLLPKKLYSPLLSLDNKIDLYNEYTYEDVCQELKKRILRPDECNRYEVIKLMHDTFDKLPTVSCKYSLSLGNPEYDYSFLLEHNNIPTHPKDMRQVLQESTKVLNGQMRWHNPAILYNIDPSIMFNTIVATAVTNLYNPSAMAKEYSSGFLEMENQIVRQLSELIGWENNQSAGVFTPGGKICLSYGIKAGLNRCSKYISNREPVVLCSDINHFSIESVVFQLGLPKTACIRIPVNEFGTIDFIKFKDVLISLLNEEIPIACIIFSGGNTTHCNVESLKTGNEILQKLVKEYNSPYIPFIYYDLVVCWPWLFFRQYNFQTNPLSIDEKALRKINYIYENISHASLADGIGIDFHKSGFSPLTNSLFLTKNREELYSLTKNDIQDEYRKPYHYTFFNSRGATDIISAWNILQSVGIEGFQSYIGNMITVTNIIAETLQNYRFEIIMPNDTYGFANIIWCSSPDYNLNYYDITTKNIKYIENNNRYLFGLTEFLKQDNDTGYYVRFQPNYNDFKTKCKIAVIVVFTISPNIDKDNAEFIANEIGKLKLVYDENYRNKLFCTKSMPIEIPK